MPNEDQGYILGMTILDDGAVQNRTRDVTRVVMDVLRKNPAVDTVMTLNGLDITSMSSKSNYGTFFAVLKPWSERTTPESSASAISTKVLGVTMMQPEAVTIGFTPPPISGMSTTGGFEASSRCAAPAPARIWKPRPMPSWRKPRPVTRTASPSIRPSVPCAACSPPVPRSSTPTWTVSAARTWASASAMSSRP